MYFLAGGGRGVPFDEGRTQFFTLAGSNRDIVIIAQSLENKEFANRVFEYFAANRARSITCLSITSRSQANDPRLAKVIEGADVLWFGGGSQSFFLESWKGTLVHTAIRNACAAGVSVGGTSAGSAVLGAAAYADLPWDSVQSCFALRDPEHDRLRTIPQGEDGFPFESLSSSLSDPLYGLIVETHFVDLNRMGRLAVFASRCRERPMSGLGIAACTAILIKPLEDDWTWTVFGSGSVFVVDPGAAYCLDKGSGRKDYHCDRVHVVRMRSGEHSRLSEIRNAPPSYRAFIREGVVYTLDNAGRLY
jgi:cyanophycinase-like exopeptidase